MLFYLIMNLYVPFGIPFDPKRYYKDGDYVLMLWRPRIDDDILLTIKDDTLREKLLNVNLLITKIDALRDNPTPSSDVVTKKISSGSPTTRSDLSLLDYKDFYINNDHFKEKSSGSTTTHIDFSQYDSFIFDLSNDQFLPANRSDFNHEEFADELTHIMSLPKS
ncbi:hypothetical protein Tco_0640674 [Tanacetum coccineum]